MDTTTLTNPATLGGCVYYSQNREDLILLSFFPDVAKGTYVDVGAFDPDYDSVTKLFYLKGWTGINIEPQLERFKLFEARRPLDTNLNVGISNAAGELTLRAYKSGGLSTFSDAIKHDYEQQPDDDTSEFVETVVPVLPLRDIFKQRKTGHIHFLKVDVEGLEYEVLSSNDWKKYRPEVLCIESNHIQHDWRPLLTDAGYELVFNDGLNDYYADKQTNRKAKFDLVKDVIHDRGGGIRAEHFELMTQLYELATQKSHHVDELAGQLDALNQTISRQQASLDRYLSIRTTAKHLLGLLSRKLAGKKETK